MSSNSLERFIEDIQTDWGPISSKLVARCRQHLNALTAAKVSEEWLARLLAERPASRELHRDSTGFMLLAHAEQMGLYRPPHDHGRAWVVYAVQSGALEVGTYAKAADADGERLVRRDTSLLHPGEARAYLPGDIHDTRCVTQDALVLRFTERDLRHEDHVERRLTRFIDKGGEWFAPQLSA
jgi:hypothetical protein